MHLGTLLISYSAGGSALLRKKPRFAGGSWGWCNWFCGPLACLDVLWGVNGGRYTVGSLPGKVSWASQHHDFPVLLDLWTQEFRRLMLEDEWVASKLRSACEEQLKQVEWSDHGKVEWKMKCIKIWWFLVIFFAPRHFFCASRCSRIFWRVIWVRTFRVKPVDIDPDHGAPPCPSLTRETSLPQKHALLQLYTILCVWGWWNLMQASNMKNLTSRHAVPRQSNVVVKSLHSVLQQSLQKRHAIHFTHVFYMGLQILLLFLEHQDMWHITSCFCWPLQNNLGTELGKKQSAFVTHHLPRENKRLWHVAKEHVAVKVALGVLLLLFVLNLIEPTLKNISPLRGLRFCDKLATWTRRFSSFFYLLFRDDELPLPHTIHGTGIVTYIYHKDQPNVGKYTPYIYRTWYG